MRVHHIAVQVRDLERARGFYVDVLGLKEVRRQPHSLWLDADGSLLMLELPAQPPTNPDEASEPWQSGRVGLHLLALAIGADEREVWRARLLAAGAPIEGETGFTLYTRDPDGTRIGLSSYPEPARTST